MWFDIHLKKEGFNAQAFLIKEQNYRTKLFREMTLEDRAKLYAQDVSGLVDTFIAGNLQKGWPTDL